jgi:rhodanese-related sulfurtransferase
MVHVPLVAFLLLLAPLCIRADGFQTPAIAPVQLQARQGAPDVPAVIDLRDPVEYRIAHVPGAINIPQPNLERRLEEIDRSRGLVLYCIAGKRTKLAEQTLLDQGVDKVFHLDGGLTAWIDAGYPIKKGQVP